MLFCSLSVSDCIRMGITNENCHRNGIGVVVRVHTLLMFAHASGFVKYVPSPCLTQERSHKSPFRLVRAVIFEPDRSHRDRTKAEKKRARKKVLILAGPKIGASLMAEWRVEV